MAMESIIMIVPESSSPFALPAGGLCMVDVSPAR